MLVFNIFFGLLSLSLLANPVVRKETIDINDPQEIISKDELRLIDRSYHKLRNENESPWITQRKKFSIHEFSFYAITSPAKYRSILFGISAIKVELSRYIPVIEFEPYSIVLLYCPQTREGETGWSYVKTHTRKFRVTGDFKTLLKYETVLFSAIDQKKNVIVTFDNGHCLIDDSFRILSIELGDV